MKRRKVVVAPRCRCGHTWPEHPASLCVNCACTAFTPINRAEPTDIGSAYHATTRDDT